VKLVRWARPSPNFSFNILESSGYLDEGKSRSKLDQGLLSIARLDRYDFEQVNGQMRQSFREK
jgi:hypothetical protein